MSRIVNAKEELLDALEGKAPIECGFITCYVIGRSYIEGNPAILKQGYSKEDMNSFLASIDAEYSITYESCDLNGVIWLTDGTWLERCMCSGYQQWEHRKRPDVIDDCKGEKS